MRARVKKHNGQIRRNKPLWQEFFFCVISSRVYRLEIFGQNSNLQGRPKPTHRLFRTSLDPKLGGKGRKASGLYQQKS